MTKFCIICGQSFTCTNPKQKYCYQPCNHQTPISFSYPQLWGDSCCVCGNRAKSLSHRSFCSIACRNEHIRRSMPVNICRRCGKPYPLTKLPRNGSRSRGFCSNACSQEYDSLTPEDWKELTSIRSQLLREMYRAQMQDIRTFMKSLFLPVDNKDSTHSTSENEKPF